MYFLSQVEKKETECSYKFFKTHLCHFIPQSIKFEHLVSVGLIYS